MKTMKKLMGLILMLSVVFACESLQDDQDLLNETGKLVVKITDAPFPADLVAEAKITIDKVELRLKNDDDNDEDDDGDEKSTVSDSIDNNAVLILSEEVQTINLLELMNGVTDVLAEAEVPSGEYKEIRLHVVKAEIVLNDGTTYDLKIPSGKQSGLKIKIKPTLVVYSGLENEVVLDFDVSRSFIVKGNPKTKAGIKGFIFKPVVRAVNNSVAGTISGMVNNESGEPIENANVRLFNDTDTITTAITEDEGYYAIIGLPGGTYKMECEHEDYLKSNLIDVTVIANEETKQNFVLVK